MGARVHIGVHAQAHRCHAARGLGNIAQHGELGFTFHVEAADAGFQRAAHLGARLAHAGEHDLLRRGTNRQRALKFTHRNDVEPAAGLRKQLQYR